MRTEEESNYILYVTFQDIEGSLFEPSPLFGSEYATVQDEEILSLSTPDGGEAWLWGPNADRTVKCEINALSPELAQVFFDYMSDGPPTIAVWKNSEDGQPIALIRTGDRAPSDLPRSWPEPTLCVDADALLAKLRSFVAHG